MNYGEILFSSVFTAAGIGAIAYLSKEWNTTRLKESIGALQAGDRLGRKAKAASS